MTDLGARIWKYRYRGAIARARDLRLKGYRKEAKQALAYASDLHRRMGKVWWGYM